MANYNVFGTVALLSAMMLIATADEKEQQSKPNTICRDRVAIAAFGDLGPDGARFLENSASEPSREVPGVISFGSWRDGPRGPIVLLTDGSRIAGNVTSADANEIEIEPLSSACKTITAAPRQIRAICFDPPRDERSRDRFWTRLLRSAHESSTEDALHLRDGSVVYGTIESLSDQTTINFRTRGEKKAQDLSLESVRALAWSEERHPPVAAQAGDNWIGLTGLLLHARKVEPAEKGQGAKVHLAAGTDLELASLEPTYWRTETATAVSLTGVEPLGFRHQPWLGEPGHFEIVAERTIAPAIRVTDELWFRGIRQPSASRLAFDLPPDATHFLTRLAVEQTSRSIGTVRFRVFGGEGESWKPLYESEIIRSGQDSLPIVVALEGATRMALVVDMADGNDVGDNAVWIDPVVTLSRDPRPPMPAASNR